ncbi:C4-dicarboxylate ABC transporter [Riemerella anatipestifer]|uniref:C4-dicarboxylate ABC transporter n=1 Tax=Riemerella anatipestifer TaxID=34085 RepID=UPI000D688EFA|nr:C4-dicarboxylate ABC transporter [Riemerella anatipestifer]MRM86064.1 C4-dicarboxylate ABC transporter [Riemerella anatipestifer]MRM94977.1 C4-dicarboxylate ABC transporter [Riemerella anatipestifer]
MFNYLSILVGVMYLTLGVVVLVYKFFVIQLDDYVAYPLGILMIIYGVFRVIRAIHNIKESKKDV